MMPRGMLRRGGAAWRLAECVAGGGSAGPIVRLALGKARATGCEEQRDHQQDFYPGHDFLLGE